jgi:hypothetical protein
VTTTSPASVLVPVPPPAAAAVRWRFRIADGGPAGVEAGTLLGVGPAGAEALAGAGVAARRLPDGRAELRAAVDGVPALAGSGVVVEGLAAIDGHADSAVGDRDLLGDLTVEGSVTPGRVLSASGALRVGGNVDRAELRAGVELAVAGRAGGSTLNAGSLQLLRRRVHRPLTQAGSQIGEMLVLVAQLRGVAAGRGRELPAAGAIDALVRDRLARLPVLLERAAVAIAEARRDWPGLAEGLAGAVASARGALADPLGFPDPAGALDRAAGFIAAGVSPRRPGEDLGLRVGSVHSCTIAAAGSLRLLGAGATDCDIDVGEDLLAMGSGGLIRSGRVRVGGKLRARELAGREGARLVVILDDPRAGDDILRVGVVQAGVDIRVGGELLRFERRRTDVRIRLEGGRPVILGD